MVENKQDDTVPTSSAYSWDAEKELSLEDFHSKYRPSMVQNDGTKPWIWVRGRKREEGSLGQDRAEAEAIAEAGIYLDEVTKRIEDIKNDDSIPVRSNKKTGAKSKKELREALQAEATEKIKEIAIRKGYVNGKWLIFAPAERIDMIWSAVATSIVSGPLKSTSAYLTKVATSPAVESPNYQHVICIYLPDVYDKTAVTEVMNVLLRNHGLNISGVKSDLYTLLGIDSKHPSGIPSTVWKNNNAHERYRDKGALKDEYFAELTAKKAAPPPTATAADEATAATVPVVPAGPTKPKPKLKKKGEDDPFASDNEGRIKERNQVRSKSYIQTASKLASKAEEPEKAPAKPALKRKKKEDEGFASSEDGEEEAIPAGKGKPILKRKAPASSSKKPSSSAKYKPRSKRGADQSEDEKQDEVDEDEGSSSRTRASKAKLAAKSKQLNEVTEEEDDGEIENVRAKRRRTTRR